MSIAAPTPSSLAPGGSPVRPGVDVMIPTWNERLNIAHSVGSVVGWANKVFVLDSQSTDGTQQIARDLGAQVVEHAWEGYARQKNWGLENLPFESEWIFILDADEAITPELRDEITKIAASPPGAVAEAGFYVNRSLIFLGKRIRHCGYFPSWNLRFFRRGAARYEDRPVHEHMILAGGKAGYLRGLMNHEDRRGLEYYIAKHNRYSTLEAQTLVQGEQGHSHVNARFFGSAVERKRFLQTRLLPHLPAKWLFRFLWMYFLRLGFLDGITGLRFCMFLATHEFFVSLKMREMRQRGTQPATGEQAPSDTTTARILDGSVSSRP